MRRETAAGALALIMAGALGCGPDNLARDRPVWTSSVRLGDPTAVVNGFVEWGGYAFHSANDSPAWLIIDLGRDHPIGEVKIYNRGDGYYDPRSSRIGIELSHDGRTFRRAATCGEIFTQASPCEVNASGATARYVMLVHRTTLVLSEVEVFEPR